LTLSERGRKFRSTRVAAHCALRTTSTQEDAVEVIDILVGEHKKISELLAVLQAGAERIVANRPPPKTFFEAGLQQARQYADQAHHFKEEYVLFGALAQKHNGELDGHIERHRNQHEQCRDLLQAISSALPGYESEKEDAIKAVHRNTTEYVRTLRSHIRSENEVFFPLAEASLTPAEGRALLDEFRRYEAKHADVQPTMEEGLSTMRALLG
jgi:hemerythrin-like domain-containing protein